VDGPAVSSVVITEQCGMMMAICSDSVARRWQCSYLGTYVVLSYKPGSPAETKKRPQSESKAHPMVVQGFVVVSAASGVLLERV